MRQLGKLKDGDTAQRIVAHLVQRRIEVRLELNEDDGDHHWTVWILSEDDLPDANALWETYHNAPEKLPELTPVLIQESSSELQSESETGTATNHTDQSLVTTGPSERDSSDDPTHSVDVDDITTTLKTPSIKLGPVFVTAVFVVLSILLSLISHFGSPRGSKADPAQSTLEQRTFQSLSLVSPELYSNNQDAFASLKRGEVWRLITSAFLHADPLHLVFNVIWLFFFGSVIERIDGSINLLKIILSSHVFGTLIQVSLPVTSGLPLSVQGNPFSMGISGAVYGMFGYLWLRPHFTSEYPVFLVRSNLLLMMGWLVICFTPFAETVPNGSQMGGLIVGIALAWSATKEKKLG